MSSIGDVDDLLRSSNESFGRLGPKKPVLGSESKVLYSEQSLHLSQIKDDSDYSDSSSDDGESGDVNNIQMDIGDLTPAKESVKTPPGDHFDIDVSLTESSDVNTPSKSQSQSQSVTKSSSLGGTRFLKKTGESRAQLCKRVVEWTFCFKAKSVIYICYLKREKNTIKSTSIVKETKFLTRFGDTIDLRADRKETKRRRSKNRTRTS